MKRHAIYFALALAGAAFTLLGAIFLRLNGFRLRKESLSAQSGGQSAC